MYFDSDIMRLTPALLKSARPRQWVKNVVVFAALLFSRNAFNPPLLLRSLAAFVAFCAVSGAVYIFNDLADLRHDRHHPLKCRRPIAAGELPPAAAAVGSALLLLVGLGVGFVVSEAFCVATIMYVLLQILYSLLFKNVIILDVFALSAGFVLRVVAGALAIDVAISSWLLVCTILLALFLALSKRRHELSLLGVEASDHRKVLEEYSIYLLDQMISVVTASTVVAYALYTMSEVTQRKFGTPYLVFTIPFVIYGIFRYLYLVHRKKGGGSPEVTLLTDMPLLFDIVAWAAVAGAIVYTTN